MNDNSKIFKQVDFLRSLDEDVLERIISAFKETPYSKEQVIFEEGEIGDCFYIVKSGMVALTKRSSLEGNITGELSFFKPCDYFGELALIDDEPRSGTATASEDTVLLEVCKENFLNTCRAHPEVLFSVVRTISRRIRETNDRYMNMWDELLKKNKLAAVGTAASKIVHDIRNPITIIILTAQLISDVYEGSEQFAQKIVNQANRVNDMVREILDFASGEKIKLNISGVNLDDYFTVLVEEFQPLCQTRDIILDIENTVSDKVWLDKDKISRLFYNLIKNAIDAFGEESGLIEIKSRISGNKLHVKVSDNGPGIPKRIIDEIFEPFITVNKQGGTGLGLAICKKIVTDHGGDIKVTNRPGKGARFDICLPLRPKS